MIEVLRSSPNVRFTAREIAVEINRRFPNAMDAKRERSAQDLSDDKLFLNQIVAEIGSNRPYIERKWSNNFRYTGDRPRKFYWSTTSEPSEPETLPVNTDAQTIREHDLYPTLQKYLEQD